MQSSLLALRLQLQQCPHAPAHDPILRVGTSCVAALWNCGCASVGNDVENMTVIPCVLHHDYIARLAARGGSLPAADQVRRELRSNALPAFAFERRNESR